MEVGDYCRAPIKRTDRRELEECKVVWVGTKGMVYEVETVNPRKPVVRQAMASSVIERG